MNMYETILALLEAQFQGTRKDGLRQLARTLALTADTEENAKAVVGKITADQVKQFITDWRKDADAEITKANQTYEAGLKQKYDLVEKGKPNQQNNQPTPPTPQEDQPLTMKAAKELFTSIVKEAVGGLSAQVTGFQEAQTTAGRKAQLEAIFGENVPESYKKAILDGFTGRTFKDDNDFNEYLNERKADLSAFTTEMANRGLGLQPKPSFGNQDPKTGISEGVTAYINAMTGKEGAGKPLSGKEI